MAPLVQGKVSPQQPGSRLYKQLFLFSECDSCARCSCQQICLGSAQGARYSLAFFHTGDKTDVHGTQDNLRGVNGLGDGRPEPGGGGQKCEE